MKTPIVSSANGSKTYRLSVSVSASFASLRDAATSAAASVCRMTQPYSIFIIIIHYIIYYGGFSTSTTSFLSELGCRLSSVSNDPNKTLYLFQRISVALQRFNSVLLHDSFPDNTTDQ